MHLALEEHLANIVAHGGDPGPAGTITVRFALEPEALRVEIEDDARPFNPLDAPEVDTALPLEEKPVGGLGILLIRKSVDELEYGRAGNRNVLVMKNRLTAP
jgi:anti-sigma regulatory factor (Ser/Thr protein kinase)